MKIFIIAAVAVLILAVSTETEGAYGAGQAVGSKKALPLPPGQVYCYKYSYGCYGNVIVTQSIFECCRIQQGLSYWDPNVDICQTC